MRRWSTVLVALLYLLPQAGLHAHAEPEAPVRCGDCDGRRGPLLECGADDCEAPGHHHHDRDHHHPGTCRTCSAADGIAVEALALDLTWTSSAFAAADATPSADAALLLGRPIRAPPAAVGAQA